MIFLRHSGDREFRNSHQKMCFFVRNPIDLLHCSRNQTWGCTFQQKRQPCQASMMPGNNVWPQKVWRACGFQGDPEISRVYILQIPYCWCLKAAPVMYFFTFLGVWLNYFNWWPQLSGGDFMYRFLGPWAQVDLCSYCHCLFPLWPLWLRRKVLILWGNTSVFHVEHCLWFSPQNALEKNSKWWIMLTLASFINMYLYAFLCFGIEFGSNWNLNMYSYMPILTKLSKRDLFWHHALILSHKDSHVLFATSLQFLLLFFCPILETFSIRLQVVNNLANSSKLQNRLVSPFVPLVFQIAKFTPTEPIFLWPRICHLQEQLLLWSHLEISRHYKTDMKEVWWNPSIAGSKHRILEPLVQVCWIFDYPRYMYSLNMPNLICSSEPEQVILNAFQRIGPDTLMGGLNC